MWNNKTLGISSLLNFSKTVEKSIFRRHSVAVAKFSDMVGSGSGGGGGSSFGATSADSGNFKFGTVFKKAGLRRKSQLSVEDHFKIRDKEPDGKLTVRKLNGLRRDSEIIFVPKKSSEDEVSEGLDNFDGRGVGLGRLGGDTHLGIFDRPGLYFFTPIFPPSNKLRRIVTVVTQNCSQLLSNLFVCM